jgi:hypothetical protein
MQRLAERDAYRVRLHEVGQGCSGQWCGRDGGERRKVLDRERQWRLIPFGPHPLAPASVFLLQAGQFLTSRSHRYRRQLKQFLPQFGFFGLVVLGPEFFRLDE